MNKVPQFTNKKNSKSFIKSIAPLVKSRFILQVVCCLIISVVLGSCSNENNESNTAGTNPDSISQSLIKPFVTFQIRPNTSDTIAINDSIKVVFNNNSFQDENGNVLEGIIELKFRSINTAAEAIIHNIPLWYDSAESTILLKTAGMHEIQVTSKTTGKPLKISQSNPLKLLVTKNNLPDTYRDFTFSYEKTKWNYTGMLTNSSRQNNDLNFAQLEPTLQKNSQIEIEIDLKSGLGNALSAYPSLKWIYAGKKGDKDLDPSLMQIDWEKNEITSFDIKASVKQKNCLDLTLHFENGQKLNTIVSPALNQSDYTKCLAAYLKYKETTQQAVSKPEYRAVTFVLDYFTEPTFFSPSLMHNIDLGIPISRPVPIENSPAPLAKIRSNLPNGNFETDSNLVCCSLGKFMGSIETEVSQLYLMSEDQKSYYQLSPQNILWKITSEKNIVFSQFFLRNFENLLIKDASNSYWSGSVIASKIREANNMKKIPSITFKKVSFSDAYFR